MRERPATVTLSLAIAFCGVAMAEDVVPREDAPGSKDITVLTCTFQKQQATHESLSFKSPTGTSMECKDQTTQDSGAQSVTISVAFDEKRRLIVNRKVLGEPEFTEASLEWKESPALIYKIERFSGAITRTDVSTLRSFRLRGRPRSEAESHAISSGICKVAKERLF